VTIEEPESGCVITPGDALTTDGMALTATNTANPYTSRQITRFRGDPWQVEDAGEVTLQDIDLEV
jgi:hypothetical protein